MRAEGLIAYEREHPTALNGAIDQTGPPKSKRCYFR